MRVTTQTRQTLVCIQAFICISTFRMAAAQVHRMLCAARECTRVKTLYHLHSGDP